MRAFSVKNHQEQVLDLLEHLAVCVDHGQIAIVSSQRSNEMSYGEPLKEVLTIEYIKLSKTP